MSSPTVVIHGGAGSALGDPGRERRVRDALEKILDELWEDARAGETATDIAEKGCVLLEDCPYFNAGLGSKIQRDGTIRMSAALMDGKRRTFSGVVNVERVKNPIEMARFLQGEGDRVVDGRGAELLARRIGIPICDPIVERRFSRWVDEVRDRRLGEETKEGAEVPEPAPGTGTVGVVVRDGEGRLAASTSTGGRGFEHVGRVSDSATVAGNYATDGGAVSCTGTGEDIVDEALAARIVVRMEDGASIEEALRDSIQKTADDRRIAAIAVDDEGRMDWDTTTDVLLGVGRDDEGMQWAF